MLKKLVSLTHKQGTEILKWLACRIHCLTIGLLTLTSCILITGTFVIIWTKGNVLYKITSATVTVFLVLLNMFKFRKWPACGWLKSAESLGSMPSPSLTTNEPATLICLTGPEAQTFVEDTIGDDGFIQPKFEVINDEVGQTTTLTVELPTCKRECVKVKTFDKRYVRVLAVSAQKSYRLQYKLHCEAIFISNPYFSAKNSVLTCRFIDTSPKCNVCGKTLTCDSMTDTRDLCRSLSHPDSISVLDDEPLSDGPNFELVTPRYYITYGGKFAMFEARLKGCKYSTQVKYHVGNHNIMLLAFISVRRQYFLDLRLESSTDIGFEAHYDQTNQMFTCSIPLLGHYECRKCMTTRCEGSQPDMRKNKKSAEKIEMEMEQIIDGDDISERQTGEELVNEKEMEHIAGCANNDGQKGGHKLNMYKAVASGSGSSGCTVYYLDTTDGEQFVGSPHQLTCYSTAGNTSGFKASSPNLKVNKMKAGMFVKEESFDCDGNDDVQKGENTCSTAKATACVRRSSGYSFSSVDVINEDGSFGAPTFGAPKIYFFCETEV